MTELTSFERDLARALDGYLGPRRPVDARAVSRAAVATRAPLIRPTWRLPMLAFQRAAWVALVALALVALLIASFVVGQQKPSPTPVPSQLAVVPPSTAQVNPTPAIKTPVYETLLLRNNGDGSVDLFAAQSDGSERPIRHFTTITADDADTTLTDGPWAVSEYAAVSSTGWLAMQTGLDGPPDAYAFFDLKNPERRPWLLPYWAAIGGAWSPQGLFAMIANSPDNSPAGTDIVDPEQHSLTHKRTFEAKGAGPTIYWTADGSGFVWGPGSFAAADRRGPRVFGEGGTTLCNSAGGYGDCPADPSIGMVETDGSYTDWSQSVALRGNVLDQSFAADRKGLWAIVEDDSGIETVWNLVRLTAPGTAQVVATIERSVLPGPRATSPTLSFANLAPDDSLVVLYQVFGPDNDPQIGALVVPTDGSPVHAYSATSAGFAPAADVAAWPVVP